MTPHEPTGFDEHPTTLLPWLLTDKLSAGERESVSAHVETCEQCRSELESLRELRAQVREAFSEETVPGMAARREVMRRVRAPANGATRAVEESLLDRFAQVFRMLLAPKWAPAALVALLVVQFGWLATLLRTPDTIPQVTSRGLDAPTARIRLWLADDARAGDVATLLRAARARIMSGPAPDGAYIIEVPANGEAQLQAKLRMLRERTGIVSRAEALP